MGTRAEYLGPGRRRPLVLDAAQAIFAEGGFADTSMASIAARAGVSKPVLYDCFPGGKQEIYLAMVNRAEDVLERHVLELVDETSRLPLEDGLRAGLTRFVEYACNHPEQFTILFGDAGTADPEIARRIQRGKESVIARMGARTRQILAAAGMPMTPVAEVYNRSIAAIAEELARWMLREPSLPRADVIEAVVQWLMQGFERIVPGEAWRQPMPEPQAEAVASMKRRG